jgi:phenylalanyl-tRNA synthetase beta chain
MKLELKFINKWLGLDLKEPELKKLLEKMGHGYEKGTALIPAYRPDIIHMVDLSEDIAISFGYENFTPIIPRKATTGKEDDFEKFRKKVSYLLTGLDMLEASSFHISNKELQLKKMNNNADDFVELLESKSDGHNLLRYSVLASLMQILGENTHNEYPQNLFESAICFRQTNNPDSETGIEEINHLAVVLCGNDTNYTKIKQVLDYLMRHLDLKYEIKETANPAFISGRAGKIILDGKEIGFLGEIHPQVIDNFGVEMPIAGMEIDLKKIFEKI